MSSSGKKALALNAFGTFDDLATLGSAFICLAAWGHGLGVSEQPAPHAEMSVGASSGARIKFSSPVFTFNRLRAGDNVKHSFVFTNTGDQILMITNVQIGCGCVTPGEWSRRVEPGRTGVIPLELRSGGYSGQVMKTVSVISNDRSEPLVLLRMQGFIWKAVDVIPQYCALNVPPDSQVASNMVRIVSNLNEPLVVWAPECDNSAFVVELRTNRPGKEYQLLIMTAPPPLPSGSVQGHITVRTSATDALKVTVPALMYMQPAVSVVPAEISLPPAPLKEEQTTSVMIISNSTNRLSLLEPVVNSASVEAHVLEVQPGRCFQIKLTFPMGFDGTQGEPIMLTMKSSHPRFSVLKVPIHQLAERK